MEGLTRDEVITILTAVAGAALSALSWWAAREAAAGRLAHGNAMGIRSPRTLSSEAAWRRGHAVALPWTLAGRYVAGLLAVAALVAIGLDRTLPEALVLAIAGLVAAVGIPLAARSAINRDPEIVGDQSDDEPADGS